MWPSEVEATYTLRGLDVLSQKAGVGLQKKGERRQRRPGRRVRARSPPHS